MFEVLMYLFENYLASGGVALSLNPDTIVTELEQAGFSRSEIGKALDWLDGLNRIQEIVTAETPWSTKTFRIKWVVLIALFSQPDKKSALSLLQDMILSDAFEVLH
jgi:Smg protein